MVQVPIRVIFGPVDMAVYAEMHITAGVLQHGVLDKAVNDSFSLFQPLISRAVSGTQHDNTGIRAESRLRLPYAGYPRSVHEDIRVRHRRRWRGLQILRQALFSQVTVQKMSVL